MPQISLILLSIVSFFPPIIPSHLNAKPHKKKTQIPNHPSIYPSLQGVFCFALVFDQGRGGGKEKRNIFAQAGAVCRIRGLILDWWGARHSSSICSACAIHQRAQPKAAWETGTRAFPALAFVKYSLAWLLVAKDQEVGWGPSLPCLARGIFLLWSSSSSQEVAGPRSSQGADAVPVDPGGKNCGEGSSSIFLLRWEWEWELPQSIWFRSCVLGWNLTTKSSHMPWGQQMPPAASEANKRK